MDLESAARELYALLPGEFTAARNAKAKEATQDGDKALAARLRSLPKPTAAAWLLNMMARHRRDEIDGVIELGAAMSQAQQELDPGQMRALGDQRRGLLSAMASSGRQLADELGHPVSPAVATEVEQTLRAAMSDPAAGAALASGLLTESFSSTGLDPVDLNEIVAVPEAVGSPAPAPPRRSAKTPARDELAERRTARAERAAKQEAEEAERRRRLARAEVDKAEQRKVDAEAKEQKVLDKLDQLQNRRDALAGEVTELKQRIEDLKREVASTDRKIEAAEEDLVSAAKTADRTRKAAAAAQRELDQQA
ncbi:hypothetical protein [Arthrobacter sulfonylureivorans]|uniref:Transposase n=1 Tax=Arthrobacter sulfonylureivorans TaxID=2486855 RepID=A0ABY3WA42_9MICC|nr:hypothetical protein [Arthrobacter sulfonylureivorans]UNK46346.1 hypothetical protein MNQ99_02960 [Arthrobacter sulfonylureivorans]